MTIEAEALALAGEVWAEVRPVLKELLVLLVTVGFAAVRMWAQRRAAVAGTTEVEVEHVRRKLAGMAPMTSEEKKGDGMAKTRARLPLVARPFTQRGLDRLVERAVPKARESVRPPPPEGER